MKHAVSLSLTLLLLLTPALIAQETTPTSTPDPVAAAKILRSEIDATVRNFLNTNRPDLPAPGSAEAVIQETVNREVQTATTDSGEKPKTFIQFLKKKKQSNKEEDRAAGIQSTMATTNAQTQRELAIALLADTKTNAFNRIKQDLLWRSAIEDDTNVATLNLLDANSLTKLINDYWWASTRLDTLQ
ncbi:MAG: hypothetical protein AAF591_17505 [Verrucomicrobiota bacterium]